MEQLLLQPIAKVDGEINLPGSKSLSNRALLLAALAQGTTTLTNLLDSDDIRHMLNALKKLGVNYQLSKDKKQCVVEGLGRAFNTAESGLLELFLGNAGTAMRPLCAALCLGQGEYILTGEARMFERPIGSLVDALQQAGAQVTYLENENYPPLKIKGTGLKGGKIKIDGSVSSQFLTAFLMAAPMAMEDTEIEIVGELVSKPYIKITLQIMHDFGIDVDNHNFERFIIKGKQTYSAPGHYLVEGDASSASYFLAAGAIAGGCIKVTGIGKKSVQGDIQFADALEAMGAKIEWGDDYIKASKGELKAIDMDMNHIPDAAMTIAVAALFATGTTKIRNVYNWRVKETDRLYAMATELRKVGATVVEGHDFIEVTAPEKLIHAEIDTYDDHRMAMCFSLVALGNTQVTINDPKCTSKTFPDYFEKLASVSC
ncbi:3-phosphoshikimate 1-carboxyvinyltransferase [Psychromonas ingrahamii 37]|uniref:3-phosphoshikimate 1-carboxyvinyltransferase n=1 Tax=Psychromonas ingrahamii (strain DSM 17664 / CCUG 51855 / 37) TaxID=357804 RepID=AROA_PSYIN|nr:3-phosphoshikimate 1-carboxyvinyltransferase [Psychromonas ingrahamii]A1STZ0.1 RecName: Full=3-phosphoshikimate 1-carboxyvinyltransferase; AltName: Full=5-enolpyruvylshikimate-3-phosphate synthase; Short=EPSP synthase; Short=EPSPS [Psychromonas ingrahamii 37]ABM02955.1 3-phosphoshikimate 1-carboxyvinyltransferase [Psychromonas ingrahamii 37]